MGSARMGNGQKLLPNLMNRDQACQRPLPPLQGVTAQKCFCIAGVGESSDIVHKRQSENSVLWHPLPRGPSVQTLQTVSLKSSSVTCARFPSSYLEISAPHTQGLEESRCRSLQLSLQGCLLLERRAFQAQRGNLAEK